MKLTVHLFRSDADDVDDLIRSDKAPQQVTLRRELSVPCQAWTMQNPPRPPSWADVVDPLIDASGLRNSSSSLLLVLRVRERFFAVTFGYSNALLRDDLLEPDFGLRVAANAANPERVAAMQARTVNENSRQLRSQTTNRSRVADFGLEIESEWLRYLRGDALGSAEFARTIGGSQNLSVSTDKSITELPEPLEWMLEQFTSDAYKTKFPYLDNFAPVPKTSPITTQLNRVLAQAIEDSTSHRIGVGSPDDLMGAEVQYYKITGDRVRNRTLEELTTAHVLDTINASPSDAPLDKLKITPVDPNDVRIRPPKKLRDYLVFETDLDDSKYVLCLGQWFKVSSSYVEEINDQIAKIDDLTDELSLPDWPLSPHTPEDEYNEAVANERNWLLMDKQFIRGIGGPHQKLEACDLMTDAADFICVKRMESSATLSHLFSQAAVSATLYREDADGYRGRVEERWNAKWPDNEASTDPRMVMAIATDRTGDLPELLHFFSKVNLVQRLPNIRGSRFLPALAKIKR